MNLKTQSILAAFALAIVSAAQAGPGPRDPGTARPRAIATREVTMTCPRCQQPSHVILHHAIKPTKAYATTTKLTAKVM